MKKKNTSSGSKKRAKKTTPEFMGTTVLYDENATAFTVGLVKVNTSTFINWWRCWIDDLCRTIKLIGNSKIDVFIYVLENTNRATNEFGGTVREISEKTGASTKTVQEVINKLIAAKFMRKKRVALYMVNPEILNYGNEKKVGFLLLQYSNLQEPTPIEKAITERQERKKLEAELNSDTEKFKKPKITIAD